MSLPAIVYFARVSRHSGRELWHGWFSSPDLAKAAVEAKAATLPGFFGEWRPQPDGQIYTTECDVVANIQPLNLARLESLLDGPLSDRDDFWRNLR